MTEPNKDREETTAHIVVGVQNDETGRHAFERAAAIARLSDAVRLHLCHAVESDADGDIADALTIGKRLLGDWAAKQLIGTKLVGRTELHVDVGDAADMLRQVAVDVRADMIVIGTHDKKTLRRIVDGSVVQSLVLDAPCAVVIAKPADYADASTSPRIEEPLSDNAAARTLGAPHTYGYERAVPLNFSSSTVGAATVTKNS